MHRLFLQFRASSCVLVLAALLAGSATAQPAPALPPASAAPFQAAPALPGKNSLSNLVVKQLPDGRWMLDVDYFFTGEPQPVLLQVWQAYTGRLSNAGPALLVTTATDAKRGANHHQVELQNPAHGDTAVTTQVQVTLHPLRDVRGAPLAKVVVDQRIRWPDPMVAEVEKAIAAGQEQGIVDRAARMIDSEDRDAIDRARQLLQALVERKPRIESAYLELARVRMKFNWNAAGRREAETLIRSALQVRPDSADAKILLGYVLAHQQRHAEAEPLFAQAAATNPPNLWLWANWGELLAMQGKKDAAVQKYREAIRRPPTRNTYDRAREDAYWHLLKLVEDVDGQEALYKQRAADYPERGCFGVHYARFLVLQRADGAAATTVLRDASSPQCDAEETRKVQGLVHYVRWSRSSGAARTDALLQARAFLPGGAHLLYALATSDRSAALARQLLAEGDALDAQCSENLDALGHALRDGDVPAARRLLALGAKPDAPQGQEQLPAALIPVLNGDLDAIGLLRKSGVDYTRLRFQGVTALDVARQRGDAKLLQALDPRGSGL